MSELAGRVALVTGGGRGIGAATARLLAARGARVALLARTAAQVEAAAQAIRQGGGEALPLAGDVADAAAVDRAFRAVREALGPVDLLVNAAGTLSVRPLRDTSLEDWRRVLDVNATGTYLCARAALADMLPRRRGVIVNVASVSGVEGVEKLPGLVAYAASKAAVIGFSEALAAEVAPAGVRVACVSPGSVRTDMLAQAAPEALAGAMAPEAVAEVIAFLTSDAGAAVTRTNVVVWGALAQSDAAASGGPTG